MRLLAILATSCFVSSMSMRIVDPIVPEMARDLGVAASVVALLASAFTFPYALGQPVLGSLGDTLGKALIIKITLVVLVVSLVLCAVAPSIEIVYAARIVGGAAAGGIIPLAFALVGDRFEMAERQVALSRLLAAIIAGQLTGSVGSGLIADSQGWRTSMALGAVLAGLALLLTLLFLKPRRDAPRSAFSLDVMRRAYGGVLANRQSWICFPMVFLEGIVIFGLFPFIAVLLEARGAGGIKEAGFVLAGFGIGGLIYTALVRVLLRRLGVIRLMQAGAAIAGSGLALLALAVAWPVEFAIFSLVGVGFYMIHNSLQTFATELAPENRGAGVAAHAFFFFLGQGTGPVVYGLMLDSLGPDLTLLIAGTVFALLGFAAAIGLRRLPA
jgi:predicted MFS family arabinose efflux permease